MSQLLYTVSNIPENKNMIKIVDKKQRSINFGVVGSGQGGSRLAEYFGSLNYSAVAINTASQDLEHISLPEDCKLLLKYGLGGAAKELEIGRLAAEENKDAIAELLFNQLKSCDMLILCVSLGGGSGAGSVSVLIDLMSNLSKPIMVLGVLPMANEDLKTKENTLETLEIVTRELHSGKVCNLILVDNAKIETLYAEVSQMEFYPSSNKAIINPLNIFNRLSSTASPVKGLDSAEFAKLLTAGGLCVYGEMQISELEDETSIAEAVLTNLNSNLLTGEFDLTQAKYAGFILTAPKSLWEQIPSSAVNYIMSRLDEVCEGLDGVFKGIYIVPSDQEEITVYSMFSGLSLPKIRIEQLKEEVESARNKSLNKESKRSEGLMFKTGDLSVSSANKMKNKVSLKKSGFGTLMGANKKK